MNLKNKEFKKNQVLRTRIDKYGQYQRVLSSPRNSTLGNIQRKSSIPNLNHNKQKISSTRPNTPRVMDTIKKRFGSPGAN